MNCAADNRGAGSIQLPLKKELEVNRIIPIAALAICLNLACMYTQPALETDKPHTTPASETGPLEDAYNAYNQNRYYDAIVICDNVTLNDKDNAEACLLRGVAYCVRDDILPGVESIDEAFRLNPGYLNDTAPRDRALDLYDREIRKLDPTSMLKPRYSKAFTMRAVSHLHDGDAAAAIRCSDEAIRLQPTNARAHAARGDAYLNEGRLETAFDDFRQAVRIKPVMAPTITRSLQRHASAARAQGDDASAQKCVEMIGTLRGR